MPPASEAINDASTGVFQLDPDQLPMSPVIPQMGDHERISTSLHRGLSARQVQMIAIAGTIGTGLFLGTGRSLAQGGPASMLICYAVVGFIVYVTLLLLGEMATQYPVAGAYQCFRHNLSQPNCPVLCVFIPNTLNALIPLGSFNAYTTRFFSPSYGFALSWNYWFNDAVSVASDLTAAQLVIQYWTPSHTWIVGLVFWVFLVCVNAAHVKAYGELGTFSDRLHSLEMTLSGIPAHAEYWLASLKVIAIITFIIVGILVNVGMNREYTFIGVRYWYIPGAPFVGGFGGFAKVFVTASYACESLFVSQFTFSS